jgi:hypothetical protein
MSIFETQEKNSLILSTNPIELTSAEIYCVISTANLPTHFIEINSTAPSIKQDTNASPLCTN